MHQSHLLLGVLLLHNVAGQKLQWTCTIHLTQSTVMKMAVMMRRRKKMTSVCAAAPPSLLAAKAAQLLTSCAVALTKPTLMVRTSAGTLHSVCFCHGLPTCNSPQACLRCETMPCPINGLYGIHAAMMLGASKLNHGLASAQKFHGRICCACDSKCCLVCQTHYKI